MQLKLVILIFLRSRCTILKRKNTLKLPHDLKKYCKHRMPPIELYKGSKNYWRLRTNVDFHILEHPDEDVVEIICFHPVLHLEAPRVFLSISKYTQSLESSKLEDLLSLKREELSRKRTRLAANEVMHMVIRESIVQFILTRAQMVLDTAEESFCLLMVPLAGDTVDENQQLVYIVPQPESLRSHTVQRGGRLRRYII